MSLDKAIESGKEHRKQYRGGKAVDKTCRNHGGCPYCEENRLYSTKKRKQKSDYKEEEDDLSNTQYQRQLNKENVNKYL